MNPPTIAVVIPSIGRESLARAVASVASQSFLATELIVVLNGAPSGVPLESLREVASPVALTVHSLPPMSGPAISRNMGAWMSHSTYVAFLDDDDEFAPTYLVNMARCISDSRPDVLYGTKNSFSPDGRLRRVTRLDDVPAELWLDRMYSHHNLGFGGSNMIVRRDAFLHLGGFPVDLRSGEDRAFAMSALSQGLDVTYVPDAHVYCHHSTGYRAHHAPAKWLSDLKIMRSFWAQVSWTARIKSGFRLLRTLIKATMARARA